MLEDGPLVDLLHNIVVNLYFFQGYELELQLLCIEIKSGILLQDVQHLSGAVRYFSGNDAVHNVVGRGICQKYQCRRQDMGHGNYLP